MHLKSIEAVGFKSFAEKVKLEFGKGISVIVGPNGCGKSNISDAIKWVLGEQSAKSLRTSQMTDVIFNGTENRRPALGMAEVTLQFDNTDGTLPVDYTEVSVTRKLYRSGEGEYFINKSPCRLKDIRDLFAGTGIGADGYSIVEQRKVEFIIESKPEQRRELIEEAAGISKYKFRKEEALRKLQKVRQDLDRINDVLLLHEEQVKSLESSARKARQHRKLQEELRRAELAALIKRIDDNRAGTEELKNALEPLVALRDRNVSESGGIMAETEKIRAAIEELDKEIMTLRDDSAKLSARIELADSRIAQADEMSRSAAERIEARALENERMESESKRLSSEESSLKDELAVLEKAASDVRARYDDARRRHEDAAAAAAERKKEEEAVSSEILSRVMPLKMEISSASSKLESDLFHVESRLSRNRRELEEAEKLSVEAAGRLKTKEDEKITLDAQLADMGARIASSSERSAVLAAELSSLKSRMAEASQTVSILEGELSAMRRFEESDPVLSAVKALRESGAAGGKIRGPVAEMFDFSDDESRDAVAVALGEKSLYLCVPARSAALEAVDFLKREGLTSLTFIVEDELPPAVSCDEKLLAGVVPVSGGSDMKILRYLLDGAAIADGVVSRGALVRGGAKPPASSADTLRLIAMRDESLAAAKSALTECAASLESKSSEAAAAETDATSLESELKTASARARWMTDEIEQLSKMASERAGYADTVRSEIESLESEAASIREEIARLGAKSAETAAAEEELKKRLAAAREKTASCAPEADAVRLRFEEVGAELYTIEPKIESLGAKLAAAAAQKSVLRDSVGRNLKEIETWKAEIINHDKIKTAELEILSSGRGQAEKLETRITGLFREKEELTAKLDSMEDEIRRFASEKEEINEKIHKLEMDIRALAVSAESDASRLSAEYETDENSARQAVSESLLDAEEMAKLKKRIEVLGAVNLAAPEEYDALSKKYEFILAQKNDLEKAGSDLEEIIRKINKTTKEQLTTTFSLVRDNFRDVFSKLFEGGQGDLVLTDPDNILESGVEIVARPPGKTTKSISLSGGEKALTAVALLFAFYLVRPAPFCLLDEADAPLDEANVERFLNLLSTFTDRSQFLIITHNKRTMLRGDVIYGITMEEFGVSKAISMKFEQVSGEAVPA